MYIVSTLRFACAIFLCSALAPLFACSSEHKSAIKSACGTPPLATADRVPESIEVIILSNAGPWNCGKSGDVQIRGAEVGFDRIVSVTKCLAEELRKYPPKTLNNLLKTVYLTQNCNFRNLPLSGSYGADFVIVGTDVGGIQVNNEHIIRTFHHEVSSLILNQYGTEADIHNWHLSNPDGFEYMGSQGMADPDQRGLFADDADLQDGFILSYSKTSVENDFNSMAEMLFVYPRELISISHKYKAIDQKLRLLIDVYSRADRRCQIEWFENAEWTVSKTSH